MRSDLTLGIKAPHIRRTLPVTLNHEQVQACLAACPAPRERLVVLLMVQLGMRAGEVANAQTGDVDLQNRLMRIRGKGGHERVEPIPAELYLALVVWLRAAPAGPLIARVEGSTWLPLSRGYVSLMATNIMYAAGVKAAAGDMVTAHALRRTADQRRARAGRPAQRRASVRRAQPDRLALAVHPPSSCRGTAGCGRGPVVSGARLKVAALPVGRPETV